MSEPRKVSPQFMAYWAAHPRPTEVGAPNKHTVELWSDPRVLDGKFYRKEGGHWVAVDNCGGEWFVEEFRRMKDAIGWLADPEGRTGDDYKAEVLKA